MHNKVLLQEMTWEEVEEAITRSGGVILIPIGSIEQHARHLPEGTDTYCAIGVAVEAAKETGAVVAPPLWYGWSPQHMAYPGTVSVKPQILIDLIVEICKSLSKHGFNKIILVNGHRISNNPWIQLAAAIASEESKAKVVPVDIAYIARQAYDELGFGPLGHGDEAETSHMLHLHPELVYMEKAFDKYVAKQELYNPDPRSTEDTVLYTPSPPEVNLARKDVTGGGSGNPKVASKKKGEKLHKYTVAKLIRLIEVLKKRESRLEL
ncbi:MAG: creatininase family protein [archaeon GB-1867-005]|nr:creatininase family protein [Candidatus Culexmicrobium cathedralense]